MNQQTVTKTEALKEVIVKGIQEIKGQKITILDLRNIENASTSFFIICEATSNTQVNAIVGSVEKMCFELLDEKPWHIEGAREAEWVLMDFVNLVVHVFQKEVREHYKLEELWGDAIFETIDD